MLEHSSVHFKLKCVKFWKCVNICVYVSTCPAQTGGQTDMNTTDRRGVTRSFFWVLLCISFRLVSKDWLSEREREESERFCSVQWSSFYLSSTTEDYGCLALLFLVEWWGETAVSARLLFASNLLFYWVCVYVCVKTLMTTKREIIRKNLHFRLHYGSLVTSSFITFKIVNKATQHTYCTYTSDNSITSYPLNTPRTRLRTKKEPKMTRETK